MICSKSFSSCILGTPRVSSCYSNLYYLFCYIPCGTTLHILLHSLWYHSPHSATFPVVPLSTFCYIPCGTTLHILLHSLWYHSPHSATFPVVPLSTFCYIPCGTTLHILLHSLWYHSPHSSQHTIPRPFSGCRQLQ